MPCKFCDKEDSQVTGYCYYCEVELCEKHNRKGRGGISYCPTCDSQFYKEMNSFIKKMKAVSKDRNISKNKIKDMIIKRINEWK